mmetsp:Transcript_17746/g.20521  ORF Transcript_17746/g.20521 Transcript_17746/m.20521 type:complete len:118 (+) Transcript_17746:35-388(+)
MALGCLSKSCQQLARPRLLASSATLRRFSTGSLWNEYEDRAGPSYLDMQATTPVDPRVLDAMLPYYHGRFGNPHSRSHSYGWDAEEATEKARQQVARLINADAKEIFFTSTGTLPTL